MGLFVYFTSNIPSFLTYLSHLHFVFLPSLSSIVHDLTSLPSHTHCPSPTSYTTHPTHTLSLTYFFSLPLHSHHHLTHCPSNTSSYFHNTHCTTHTTLPPTSCPCHPTHTQSFSPSAIGPSHATHLALPRY